jgi:hypothetical protein
MIVGQHHCAVISWPPPTKWPMYATYSHGGCLLVRRIRTGQHVTFAVRTTMRSRLMQNVGNCRTEIAGPNGEELRLPEMSTAEREVME